MDGRVDPRVKPGDGHDIGVSAPYRAAMRSAPSRRSTAPLISTLSAMCSTSFAYSAG
jgi:hypothetical protein